MRASLSSIDDLIAVGEIKKAEVLIASLLRSSQNKADETAEHQVLFRRARIRLLSGRPDDALNDLAAFQQTLPSESQDPSVLELIADCYFARFELASMGFSDRNDTIRAQQIYSQITADYPRYSNLGWIYYQLGRILITTSNINDAIFSLKQALFAPTNVNYLTAYCYERLAFIAFYEQRDLEIALAFLNRAVDTYPSTAAPNWLAQVHLLRSRVLKGLNDYTLAMKAAEKALEIVYIPNTGDKKTILPEALLTTAELLTEMEGKDKDVISILQTFVQNSRKPPGVDVTWSRVNEMLGNAYFNLNQFERAVESYASALQFNPDHPWEVSLYYRIARSYYQLRAYEKTIDTIRQMLMVAESEGQEISDYHVYDILGNAQFALHKYEEAVDAYRTALQIAPADSIEMIKSYHDLALERIE